MAREKKQSGESESLPEMSPQSSPEPSPDVISLAKEIAKQMVESQKEQPIARSFRYPEIENEYVEVIRFGTGTIAHQTYNTLALEPKKMLFIPEDFSGKQVKGMPKHRYQLNELILWIRKGVMVEVPKTVYDDLSESIRETEKALNPLVIDGDGNLVPARLDKNISPALTA